MVALRGTTNRCIDKQPMIPGKENRIDPTVLRQFKATLKDLLWARLIYVSIEIACDDNRKASPGLLPNHSQHVLGTCVAHLTVASVTITTVNAPMGIEVKK